MALDHIKIYRTLAGGFRLVATSDVEGSQIVLRGDADVITAFVGRMLSGEYPSEGDNPEALNA